MFKTEEQAQAVFRVFIDVALNREVSLVDLMQITPRHMDVEAAKDWLNSELAPVMRKQLCELHGKDTYEECLQTILGNKELDEQVHTYE